MKIKLFSKNTKTKAIIKNSISVIVIFSLLVIGTNLFSKTTLGKYALEKINTSYFNSKNFYFHSRLLESSDTHSLYNWNGVSSYNFDIDLMNYIDNLNWTKSDINYDVTLNCSNTIICTSNATGVINTQAQQKTYRVFTVNVANNGHAFVTGDTVSVEIIVSSTSPYVKTMSATFTIHVVELDIDYYIEDLENQLYLDLFITNDTTDTKTIDLDWDYQTLSIDNTDTVYLEGTSSTTVVNNVTYTNGLSFTINSNSIRKIRFYKSNITSDYTYPLINPTSIITVTHN